MFSLELLLVILPLSQALSWGYAPSRQKHGHGESGNMYGTCAVRTRLSLPIGG